MDHELPSNCDAERGILSSMLQSEEIRRKCAANVHAEMFAYPAHAVLFRTICDDLDTPIDFVILCARLGKHALDELGGKESLNYIFNFVPTGSNWEYYYQILKEVSYKRGAIIKSGQIIQLASDDGSSLAEIEAAAMSLLLPKTGADIGLVDAHTLATDFNIWLEDLASGQIQDRGMPWGCDGIPDIIDKLRPGELCLVGGKPGAGKTSLLNSQVALECIPKGSATALFSLEMTKREETMRLISIIARIPIHHLKNVNLLSALELQKYGNAVSLLSKSKISVCDEILDIFQIYERATSLKQSQGKLDFIGIDYAQIVKIRASDERRIGLDTIGRICKYMAKELDCHVMLLTQLNADGSPFESSALEAHCDQFVEVQRSLPGDKYKDIRVRKQRNGPIGEAQVSWLEDYACLYNGDK